jgi:branched-chain amino acid transport system substrate-binding protein
MILPTPPAIRRRTLLKSGLVLTALGSPPIISARGETPVRIGLVDPLTGILSSR